MRRLGIAAVLFLMISAAVGVASAAACNPERSTAGGVQIGTEVWNGPSFDGGNCISGSQANIEVKNPYVESGLTVAWTALNDPVSPGPIGQVGWGNKTPNYTRFNFAEYADNNNRYDLKEWAASPVGDSPTYKVTYSANSFHLFVNGTNYYNFSAPNYPGCWSQNAGGEAEDTNSQMPGVPSDHEALKNFLVRFPSGNWVTTTGWRNQGVPENGNTPSPGICGNFLVENYCNSSNGGGYDLTPGDHYDFSTSGDPLSDFESWDECR